MMIILDTDILIEAFKNNKEAINSLIKVISSGETVRSTIINSEEVLLGTNKEEVKEFFNEIGVLNYSWGEMLETVRITSHLKNRGTPIGVNDEKIAGICLANNATILTRNKKHFSKVPGLKVKAW